MARPYSCSKRRGKDIQPPQNIKERYDYGCNCVNNLPEITPFWNMDRLRKIRQCKYNNNNTSSLMTFIRSMHSLSFRISHKVFPEIM